MRASHLHFLVEAPGLRTLVTHIFVRGDELLARDSVFGVRDSLVKDFVAQPASAQNNTVGGALLGGGLGAIIGGQQPAAPAVRLRVR